jgi:hypothetical protein
MRGRDRATASTTAAALRGTTTGPAHRSPGPMLRRQPADQRAAVAAAQNLREGSRPPVLHHRSPSGAAGVRRRREGGVANAMVRWRHRGLSFRFGARAGNRHTSNRSRARTYSDACMACPEISSSVLPSFMLSCTLPEYSRTAAMACGQRERPWHERV